MGGLKCVFTCLCSISIVTSKLELTFSDSASGAGVAISRSHTNCDLR
jgi:hypothetical protein